jgi:hypothetical protein
MNIGIIAEGITDIPVLSNIIAGVLNDYDISPNPLFPSPPDEGGWGNVFQFLNGNDFISALTEHNIIIIQLDADTCQDWGLELKTFNSKIDNISDFLDKIENSLTEYVNVILNKEDSAVLFDKIIFAISVGSIECWLLAFHESQKAKKSKTDNCITTLKQYTNKKYGYTIDKGGSKQKFDLPKKYDELSKPFLKTKNVDESIKHNFSFQKFVEDFKAKYEATKQQ